jgi:hypothetical protein
MAEFNQEEKETLEKVLANGTFHNPAEDELFTAGGVAWVLSNPIYAGIDPFPALIDEKTWIAAFKLQCERVGIELSLRAMLTALRQTYKGATLPGDDGFTLAR